MERLVSLIRKSSFSVAFTGAGVSTSSGIMDFRGKNGLYSQPDIDAERLFDMDWFLKDPSYYYTKSKEFIYGMNDFSPGAVHTELARLESLGLIKAVVTQNIDMLHHKAGSKNVFEIHGSPRIHRCLSCGKRWTFEEIIPLVMSGQVPYCDRCGGLIKPDITFFGEALPEDAIEGAVKACSRADLILGLGSTFMVQPAASLPLYTLQNGGKLVIVNNMPTPMDSRAVLIYKDLEEVSEFLKKNLP